MISRMWAAALLLVAAGCAPRAVALAGVAVAPLRMPRAQLAPGLQQITFTFEYRDNEMFASGEGAARVASPDSARLDLFLRGGVGSGFAIVLGDTVHAPGGALMRRLLPPTAMFWAALGRLAVPPGDTTVRVEGNIVRADIRRGPNTMRVAFEGDRLTSIENIEGDGIVERATRAGERLTYEHFAAHRRLTMIVTRTQPVESFDAAIWRH